MDRAGFAGVVAFLAIVSATACSTDLSTPTATRPTPAEAIVLKDANPVVHSVTGHWEVVGQAGNLNKVSVSAIQRLDGTVTGQAQYEQFTDDGKSILAHGDIVCMTVEGNVARLGAVGENKLSATPDAPIYVIMTVIDNGEGENDPPDRGSALLAVSGEPRARAHCAATPPIPHPLGLISDARVFWSERGNIQVR